MTGGSYISPGFAGPLATVIGRSRETFSDFFENLCDGPYDPFGTEPHDMSATLMYLHSREGSSDTSD